MTGEYGIIHYDLHDARCPVRVQGIEINTTRIPPARVAVSGRTAHVLAFIVVALLLGMRAASEFRMMGVHGSDPQMPIWGMIVLIKLAFWSVLALLAWLPAVIGKTRLGLTAAVLLLAIWSTAICGAAWQHGRAAQALADADNPATPAKRLAELAHFDGIQAGYELDNRIASNPNTSADTLRELHGRRDQVGTEMCLARNPNTPVDVLDELADHPDEYVQRSLAQNPALTEAVRRKLKPNAE